MTQVHFSLQRKYSLSPITEVSLCVYMQIENVDVNKCFGMISTKQTDTY